MSDRKRRQRPRARKFLLSLATFSLALVLSEVGLRLFWPAHGTGVSAHMVVADEEIGFRLKPHYRAEEDPPICINSDGYRNRELAPRAPGERRIVVLGDSFAFGHRVEAAAAFPQLVEDRLRAAGQRVQVINTAAPGYATRHEFHLLEQDAQKLDPDDVILAFYVGNDFLGNHTARFGRLIVQGDGLVHSFDGEPVARTVGNWLAGHSRLALLAARALQPRAQQPAAGQPSGGLTAAAQIDWFRLACANADWDGGFNFAMARRQWDADAEEAWRISLLWIAATRDLCRSIGARFHLVLLPAPYQYSEGLWNVAVQACRFDPAEFDLGKPNRMLREWAVDSQIGVLDLLPVFARENHDTQNRLYRDCHFSVLGHRLAADSIVKRLDL